MPIKNEYEQILSENARKSHSLKILFNKLKPQEKDLKSLGVWSIGYDETGEPYHISIGIDAPTFWTWSVFDLTIHCHELGTFDVELTRLKGDNLTYLLKSSVSESEVEGEIAKACLKVKELY